MVSAITRVLRRAKDKQGLNPYYTGRWFLLIHISLGKDEISIGLNPYYTGRWFLLFRTFLVGESEES